MFAVLAPLLKLSVFCMFSAVYCPADLLRNPCDKLWEAAEADSQQLPVLTVLIGTEILELSCLPRQVCVMLLVYPE